MCAFALTLKYNTLFRAELNFKLILSAKWKYNCFASNFVMVGTDCTPHDRITAAYFKYFSIFMQKIIWRKNLDLTAQVHLFVINHVCLQAGSLNN